ncbi:UNVERIFIED_CONTAM: hypothetical protein K2H54_022357 [Gekko kuhli]
MILLMAVTDVFLLLGWAWRSNSLCSPTTFYKNCWIRQFPGLTIDLELSQARGAHILKRYSAASAQHCSQTCCLLRNASAACSPKSTSFHLCTWKETRNE